MASLRTSTRINKGFTLLEILVVLTLVTVIGGLSLFFGLDSYRSNAFYVDRGLLITALERARAEAIGNICYGASCTDGKSHGVFVEKDGSGKVSAFVVFQGASYHDTPEDASFDERLETGSIIYHRGISTTIFQQLSGSVSPSMLGDMGLYDDVGHLSTTSIGTDGQVFWDH